MPKWSRQGRDQSRSDSDGLDGMRHGTMGHGQTRLKYSRRPCIKVVWAWANKVHPSFSFTFADIPIPVVFFLNSYDTWPWDPPIPSTTGNNITI